MTAVVGVDFESISTSPDREPPEADWTLVEEEAASFHQEINDRRARWERAETLRLVRAL